VDLEWSYIRPA
jgi:hypothetical protein